MSMKDKARGVVQSSLGKVEKLTGKALGDEDMPVKDQVSELREHLKVAGEKVREALKKDE